MSKKDIPPTQIRGIPSYSRLVKDAQGIDTLGNTWPLMKLLGLVKGDLPVSQDAIAELKRRGEELLNLPDRFNAAFSSRGWIAYESLNADLMRRAIELAQGGEVEKAESEILAYYKSEDTVRWHLQTMMAVRAWRPREVLANLAMTDYLAGRYHATVPVTLALMDGLVSDLAVTGFFAEGTEMTAWDSVAGHSSGLKVLCDLFNKGRRKTTTDEIQLPYRHGILHGRDLGYANEVVAAKTWAALFAVREWALKVEGGTATQPEQPEEAGEGLRSFADSLVSLEKARKDKEAMDRWAPRETGSASRESARRPRPRPPHLQAVPGQVDAASYLQERPPLEVDVTELAVNVEGRLEQPIRPFRTPPCPGRSQTPSR